MAERIYSWSAVRDGESVEGEAFASSRDEALLQVGAVLVGAQWTAVLDGAACESPPVPAPEPVVEEKPKGKKSKAAPPAVIVPDPPVDEPIP